MHHDHDHGPRSTPPPALCTQYSHCHDSHGPHSVIAVRPARKVTASQVVVDDLRARIDNGEFPPGSRLLSSKQIMDEYHVSSTTVRTVLAALANAGVAEPRHGSGTFVSQRRLITINATLTEDLGRRTGIVAQDSWSTDIKEAGHKPEQGFGLSIVPATAEQAKIFGVDPGSELTVRCCKRTVDGVPASIETSMFPDWLVAEIPRLRAPFDIDQGTTSYVADQGHPLELHLDYTSCRPFTRTEENFFDPPDGVQALVRERVSYEHRNGRVLRLMETVYRGDMHRVLHEVAGRGNARQA